MHERQHHACEQHENRDRSDLGEGLEGEIADAEAAQCPDTVFLLFVETGNRDRLERHIHILSVLCDAQKSI